MSEAVPSRAAPWNGVHVRRATAYALNRADIIAAAALSSKFTLPGYAYAGHDLIPPQAH
jgi:hypothetical protein